MSKSTKTDQQYESPDLASILKAGKSDTRLIINWWIRPTKAQEKSWGWSRYSKQDDAATIVKTKLFELYYDYEEGLKFETNSLAGVKAVVAYVKPKMGKSKDLALQAHWGNSLTADLVEGWAKQVGFKEKPWFSDMTKLVM